MSDDKMDDDDEGFLDIKVAVAPGDVRPPVIRKLFEDMVRREVMRRKQANKRDPEMQKDLAEEADSEAEKLASLHESSRGKSNSIPVTDEDVSEDTAYEAKKRAKNLKPKAKEA